jgi:hypothetical protein
MQHPKKAAVTMLVNTPAAELAAVEEDDRIDRSEPRLKATERFEEEVGLPYQGPRNPTLPAD